MSTPDRRAFLRAGLMLSATGALAGCTTSRSGTRLIHPTDARVRAAEARRRASGRTRAVTLAAVRGPVDLGGPTVMTWTYDGLLPGREIRVRRGDMIEARLVNQLPAATTIHWHGLALRNDMDGAPGVTQAAIRPGSAFTYRFIADVPGTYWFHPHVGTQLDRGLYAPLVVEDPDEPAAYDQEWTVVLDDWIDGTGYTPDQVFSSLRQGMGSMDNGGMGMGGATLMGATSALLGGDAGDVKYPHYLINGRVATAPRMFRARPGQRARIRFINAGGDTAFRVALGGHRMRVTHTDGFPVIPVDADALLIGMGERYDVLVTLADGVFPLVALAEGKNAAGLALVRTGPGAAPPPAVRPHELNRQLLRYGQLRSAASVALPAKTPDTVQRLDLTGGMMRYDWGLDEKAYDPGNPVDNAVPVREGQRVRVTFRNRTMMYHPMHIHGHTFQVNGNGPRKDTAIVLPAQAVTCDFAADNPGRWMIHCHNIYHAEAGMMTVLGYQA